MDMTSLGRVMYRINVIHVTVANTFMFACLFVWLANKNERDTICRRNKP